MKTRKRRRWTSILLVAALLLGLLPPLSAQAATVIQILDLSASSDDATITRVTNGMINVRANVTGIDPTEYQNIYYEVANLSAGGSPVVDKNNKAQKNG